MKHDSSYFTDERDTISAIIFTEKKKKTCKELEQAPIGGKGAFNPIPHLSFNFSLILFWKICQ